MSDLAFKTIQAHFGLVLDIEFYRPYIGRFAFLDSPFATL